MMSIADEIQAISENADKCINYPIGNQLAAFMKQQDESNKTNFVLSGVLIYAAAKIFGRKVDYLEQEIHGIAKNFAAVETSGCDDEKQPEKEIKKTRTKKFKIQDGVSLEKTTFEEKPIQVLTKADINKTLAMPSRINRLQKMKEFFSKNKSRTGKLVIPKKLLFTSDNVLSNFGSTQIHDYDDNKDIVGSRRDFTSFSYFINSGTGELQSDVSVTNHVTRSTQDDDDFHHVNDYERINEHSLPPTPPPERQQSPIDWETTLPATPAIADVTLEATDFLKELSPISINIDEGIELDEAELNLLKPTQPTVKLIDTRVESPNNWFPPDVVQMNDDSNERLRDKEVNNLPTKTTDEAEMKMKNIFMIPLKRLKHRCFFQLPNEEYGELKKRKRDQHKSLGVDQQNRLTRIFKLSGMLGGMCPENQEDQPFKGFTKEQQNEPMTYIDYTTSNKQMTKQRESLNNHPVSQLLFNDRKYSNDSGVETDISGDETNRTGDGIDLNDDPNDSDINASTELDIDNVNVSGSDSCYQSLTSGGSSKAELSSFFKDIESRNNSINESEINNDDSLEESEERVLQMQQSAMNIAKWREYLKPILANSEARSKIDMQQCGIEMINKIGNVNDNVALADITEPGKTPAYFLTMLQLINNRNIEIDYGERSMNEPVDMKNLKITLKSKLLHRDKFDEMGQQFVQQEEKKISLKRKAVQTSTPAKRASVVKADNASVSFNSPNVSQSTSEDDFVQSQGSSGYFSQSSIFSDC